MDLVLRLVRMLEAVGRYVSVSRRLLHVIISFFGSHVRVELHVYAIGALIICTCTIMYLSVCTY